VSIWGSKMIIIRKNKKDAWKNEKKKSFMLFIGILVIFSLLFILIPIGLTLLLHLPWYLSFIYPFGIIVGAILIISGFGLRTGVSRISD